MSIESGAAQQSTTPERILKYVWGFAPPLVIAAALQNGVFDVLDRQPMNAAELADATKTSERGAIAVADALVGIELLVKGSDERYALAPDASRFLVTGKPGYLGAMLQHTVDQLMPNWMRLPDVMRTGVPATGVNQSETGQEFFETFVEALYPMNYPGARAAAGILDIGTATKEYSVLDIASGSGVWGIALAQTSPNVRVTAVDWPAVLKTTRRIAERSGVGDRFRYVPGDVLEADFGTGYDAALLGHILHSEGAERSQELLKRVGKALKPGGTIVIAEFLTNKERTGSAHALLFAVNMLVHTDKGTTFSFEQIREWLDAAGFRNARTADIPAPSPLILAEKS